jgi:hypothetical protein
MEHISKASWNGTTIPPGVSCNLFVMVRNSFIPLPNFSQSFQKYIDDGTLIPGWYKGGGENFLIVGLN